MVESSGGYRSDEKELMSPDAAETMPAQKREGLSGLFRRKQTKTTGVAIAAGAALSTMTPGAQAGEIAPTPPNQPPAIREVYQPATPDPVAIGSITKGGLDSVREENSNSIFEAFAAKEELERGPKNELAIHNGAKEAMRSILKSMKPEKMVVAIYGQKFDLVEGLGSQAGGEAPAPPSCKFMDQYLKYSQLSGEEFKSKKTEFDALVEEMIKNVSDSNDAGGIARFLMSVGCKVIVSPSGQFDEGLRGYAFGNGIGGQKVIRETSFPAGTSIENVGQSGLAAVIKVAGATIHKKLKTIQDSNGLEGIIAVVIPDKDGVKEMAEINSQLSDELSHIAVEAVAGSQEEAEKLKSELKVATQ